MLFFLFVDRVEVIGGGGDWGEGHNIKIGEEAEVTPLSRNQQKIKKKQNNKKKIKNSNRDRVQDELHDPFLSHLLHNPPRATSTKSKRKQCEI